MPDKLTETVERLLELPVRTLILNVDTGELGAQSVEVPLDLRDDIIAALSLPINEGVSQADRATAADWFDRSKSWSEAFAQSIRDGREDDHPLVQAFRAHRVAALRGSQS